MRTSEIKMSLSLNFLYDASLASVQIKHSRIKWLIFKQSVTDENEISKYAQRSVGLIVAICRVVLALLLKSYPCPTLEWMLSAIFEESFDHTVTPEPRQHLLEFWQWDFGMKVTIQKQRKGLSVIEVPQNIGVTMKFQSVKCCNRQCTITQLFVDQKTHFRCNFWFHFYQKHSHQYSVPYCVVFCWIEISENCKSCRQWRYWLSSIRYVVFCVSLNI